MKDNAENGGTIIFDGECTMCQSAVQFLLKRDKNQFYRFTSSNSKTGKQLKRNFQISDTIDSMIVIEGEQVFLYSDAVLRIIPKLSFWWQVFRMIRFIPKSVRHRLYRFVAMNRQHFFKKQASCLLPTAEESKRILP